MFQFTGFPSVHYGFMYGYMLFSMCVPAFRHPRVAGYVLLTVAFRSLSRLSSALSARASAPRPYLLNLVSLFAAAAACSDIRGKLAFKRMDELGAIGRMPSIEQTSGLRDGADANH